MVNGVSIKELLPFIFLITDCRAFFSPVKRIEVRRNVEFALSNGTKIAKIPIMLNNGSYPPSSLLNFSISRPENLTVNSHGEMVVNGSLKAGFQRRLIVFATIPLLPSEVMVEVVVELVKPNISECQPSLETCFGGKIDFQVHADAKGVVSEVPLGQISPFGSSCQQKREYALETGERRAFMKGDVLWVRTSTIEENFKLNITCYVASFKAVRTFDVTVLQKSPWDIMGRKSVRLLNSSFVQKGDQLIVSWGFFKIGSRANFLSAVNSSLYSLFLEPKNISSIISSKTLFILKLEWRKSTNVSLPISIKSRLEIKEPGFAAVVATLECTLQLTTVAIPNTAYSSDVEVTRGLSTFTRVAYPFNVRQLPNVTFRIVLPWNLASPFNVTRTSGIVYLNSKWPEFQHRYFNFTGVLVEVRLKNQLVQITWLPVVWKKTDSYCSKIKYIPGHHDVTDYLCSSASLMKTCVNTCGHGASSSSDGLCNWIKPSKLNNNYSTCSTDKTFCPDNWCDPLEQLNIYICPQDCSTSVLFGSSSRGNLGIGKSSTGLCTCDQLGKCQCGLYAKAVPPPEGKIQNNRGFTRQEPRRDVGSDGGTRPTCDGTCLLIILTTGTTAAVLSIILIVILRKKTGFSCTAKNKSAMNYNSAYGTEALILSELTTLEPHHQIEVDEKWEIPRSCLVVEECLGEGEFGRVLKATARDLQNSPGYTTVAVKTLKENAGTGELADLLSEYQLLKKVDHKNVIKLLGACTSPGGPLYVVIEYCALGSLSFSLFTFYDGSNKGKKECPYKGAYLLAFFGLGKWSAPKGAYLRVHRSIKTNVELGAKISRKLSITSHDVMSFAYQISKGMAYLADVKLVHRDLAARNVLLSEDKICKISDFGLTRDVYEDDTYLKQSRGRVPVKWMAIESLGEHIYTTQSDVWSFGIVLWELVSLGSSPYPGVNLPNLYHLLKNGYRMPKPANCSTELYDVMRSCWQDEPDDRPTFVSLVERFGRMLEQGLDYVNFSIQMISNPSYFNSREIHDEIDDNPEMNITFKMELGALKENNNRYENHSVGPDTSYDVPRQPEQVALVAT